MSIKTELRGISSLFLNVLRIVKLNYAIHDSYSHFPPKMNPNKFKK